MVRREKDYLIFHTSTGVTIYLFWKKKMLEPYLTLMILEISDRFIIKRRKS